MQGGTRERGALERWFASHPPAAHLAVAEAATSVAYTFPNARPQ